MILAAFLIVSGAPPSASGGTSALADVAKHFVLAVGHGDAVTVTKLTRPKIKVVLPSTFSDAKPFPSASAAKLFKFEFTSRMHFEHVKCAPMAPAQLL